MNFPSDLAPDGQWLPVPNWVPTGPVQPTPPASTLTVYRVAVTDFVRPALPAALLALLTPAERARAARYLLPADQARFAVGRASLRYLLGQRLGQPAVAVPLLLSPFGKPQLPAAVGPQLHFNLTHSGDWVLLALSPRAVGIDVEKWEPDLDFTDVAAICFSPDERRYLQLSPTPRAAFYALWTRQEALAKATGRGLRDEAGGAADARWTVHSFEAAPGYPAALAYPAGWQPEVWFSDFDAGLLGG